jgi:hypothetical protein
MKGFHKLVTTSKKKKVIISLIALALHAGLVNAIRARAVPADQGDLGLFLDSVRSKHLNQLNTFLTTL